MGAILTYAFAAIGVGLTGIALIWVLQQRRSPQSALAWILFILTVPWVGVPAFFAFGVRKRGAMYAPAVFQNRAAPPPLNPLDDQLRRLDCPAATTGNSITAETRASEARATLTALVDEAEHSLCILLYQLEPDAASEAFIEALRRAALRGVEVRLVLDQVGAFWRPRRALRRLRDAGVEIRLFPVFSVFRGTARLNLRNHRKLVLADGKRLWTGGRNVGASYLGPDDAPGTWHDLSFMVEGPVVARYAEMFEADWSKITETPTRPVVFDDTPVGKAQLQLVPSGADMEHDALHDAIVHAIHTATRRIWISTPYLLPTDQIQHALTTAARLGRDVRIMLPQRSNQRVTDFAAGSYVRDLDEAGARILRHAPPMLHAKAILLDDIAIVGSANLDVRSMLINFESGLVLSDSASVAAIETWFEEEFGHCAEGVEPAGLLRRLAEATFRLGAPVL
ncbi:MAG: cardiolipin synthetase [Alphaproteobacteria bacterium]|nr:MAG: cardiolipin synthetase [Alphaproteobacteria bacterium]